MTLPAGDHPQELLAVHCLDALEDDERRELEHHLEGCARCRQALDAYRAVAAALGQRVEPVPPELWDRIAAGLATGTRRPPPLELLDAPAGVDAPAPVATSGTRVIRPARWRTAWAAVAAAAVAAACVLGAFLAHADDELTGTRQALGSTRQVAEHALTVPGHRVIRLAGASGRQLAEVVLVPGGRGYLLSDAMPSLGAGRTYQLWAVVDGTPISVGLLGAHPRAVAFNLGSARPTTLAVTVEPAGGSVAPTGTPVATGVV